MNIIQRVWNRVTSFIGPNRGGVVFLGKDKIHGVYLSAYEALRLAAVWACISAISRTLAASDYLVFEEDADGNRTYLPKSRTFQLLNVRPNPEMIPFSYHEALLVQALTWGAGFAEIEFDSMGRPAALWPLDPDCSELVRGFKDGKGFQYDDAKGELHIRHRNTQGPDTFLPYNDCIHIHGLSVDGICGLNMVSVAARPLLMMLASEKFRLAFYQHGTSLGGVLSSDLPLDETKLQELKASVKDRVSGIENAFQFLVLGAGMKWQSLSQDFDKQQFLEQNHFLIEEICRYWGVPPHVVQHMIRSTFNNIEHLGIEFNRSLRPWKKRLIQEYDYKLVPAGPINIDLDMAWAAEGDAKSVAETLGILADHGFMKRNEGRRRLGMNTVGAEGDILTIQSAMTTLERIASGENLKSVKTGAATTDEPAKPKKRGAEAARSLIKAAIKRSIERQQVRVKNLRITNRAKFEGWLKDTIRTDTNYANEQLNEALSLLEGIGVHVVSRRAGVLEEVCFENTVLLLKAYDEGRLYDWCNADERAGAAVDALDLQTEERE